MSEEPIRSRFKRATSYVQNTRPDTKLTNEQKLKFYKFYKQATEGDIYIPQPMFFQIEQRAKYNAWKSVEGLKKEDAMRHYLFLMKQIHQVEF